MKVFLHVIAFAFLIATPIAAQADPCVRYPNGKVPVEHVLPLCVEAPQGPTAMERVVAIRKTLPVPADWHFFMVSEADWRMRQGVARGTQTAYSDLGTNVTYLRESYAASAPDEKLRHTIAHEMGHRICNCTDESTADRIADQILTSATK
jgi:hypothetical protein